MSSNRRTIRACTRCRKRKTKCDLNFPQCGSCGAARLPCTGVDPDVGVEHSRSEVADLEKRIRSLEAQLATSDFHDTSSASSILRVLDDFQHDFQKELSTRAGLDFDWPSIGDHRRSSVFNIGIDALLCNSPLPFNSTRLHDSHSVWNVSASPERAGPPLHSIPTGVMRILVQNYKDTYLPQYPYLEEDQIDDSLHRIQTSSEKTTHFDYFSIGMALAISAMTLVRHDEHRATSAGAGFWNNAKLYLPRVLAGPGHQVLRSLLLLTHYSFLNPGVVNGWCCSGAALSLALQMRLHDQDGSAFADEAEQGSRRKLFWATYILNGTMHYMLRQPFTLQLSDITTPLPVVAQIPADDLSDLHSLHVAFHAWSARMLEVESMSALYCQGGRMMTALEVREWQENALLRLQGWHSTTHHPANKSFARVIQFNELIYNFLLFRLTRPSPACLCPDSTLRQHSVRAALAVIDLYEQNTGRGLLFYIWHAAYQLSEVTVFLLQYTIGLMSVCHSGASLSAESTDPIMLTRNVKSAINMLSTIGRRWPNFHSRASTLEHIAEIILEHLRRWVSSETFTIDLLEATIQEELATLTTAYNLPLFQRFPDLFAGPVTTSNATGFDDTAYPMGLADISASSQNTIPTPNLLGSPQSMDLQFEDSPFSDIEGLWNMSPNTLEDILGALDAFSDTNIYLNRQ